MQNATKPMPTSRPNATRVDASALLAALHDARALYVELLALVLTLREAVRVAALACLTTLLDMLPRISPFFS